MLFIWGIHFCLYTLLDIYIVFCIPSYLTLFVYLVSIYLSLLILFIFVTKINIHRLDRFQFIIFLCIIAFLVLLILIQYAFLSSYLGWHVAHADNEDEYNPRLQALALDLMERKREIIEQRLLNSNVNGRVTLHDAGLRHDRWLPFRPGNRLQDIYLFERFIDTYPHLKAFKQYYRFESNWTMSRSTGTVWISYELMHAMSTCTDLSI